MAQQLTEKQIIILALVFILAFVGFVFLFNTDDKKPKTYTPEQLRAMVQQGNYPQQGKTTAKTESMDFSTCVNTSNQILGAVQSNYPVNTISEIENVLLIKKAWTNDAAIVITCSAPDRKMIINTAPYL